MKKTLILILVAFTAVSTYAQKAKRKHIVNLYYNHLPSHPLSPDAKTYKSIVNQTSTRVKVPEFQLSEYLAIKGFSEAETVTDADVIMEFTLSAVTTSVDIKTKVTEKKVDDKTVKETQYYYSIISKPYASFSIKTKHGKMLKVMKFDGDKWKYETSSDLFDTKDAASKEFNKKKNALISNNENSAVEDILNYIKSFLNDNYGYYRANEFASIYTGKGKKHDYSNLDEVADKYKSTLEEFSSKGITENFINSSNECIDAWKKAVAEYEPKNKKAKISDKNIEYFYRNISTAYLYMNDFDNAIKTIKELQSLGVAKHKQDLEIRLKTAQDRKMRYELNEKRKLEAE